MIFRYVQHKIFFLYVSTLLAVGIIVSLNYSCENDNLARITKVVTGEIAAVEQTRSTVSATIVDIGSEGIDEHGHCWSTNENPSYSANEGLSNLGQAIGQGDYSSSLESLSPGTMYYVRAYVKSGEEIVHGEIKSFTTTEGVGLATVSTHEVTSISNSSALSGGNVISEGSSEVSLRGVCWSTSPMPTVEDQKTEDGSGPGSFDSYISGLSSGTTYYLRAYAINSAGEAYGSSMEFTTTSLPDISTNPISSITHNSAISGGSIGSDGGHTITAKGLCWSTEPLPDLSHYTTNVGGGSESFESQMTGLDQSTRYYVRAYLTNSGGSTNYGEEREFITDFVCGTTLTDPRDGRTYQTVEINGQCWMKENLAATAYIDGNGIPLETNGSTWAGLTSPAYCWYDNNEGSYGGEHGALYNGFAIMGGELCPTGWRVATDADWQQLESYLGIPENELGQESFRGTDEANKLRDPAYWNEDNNSNNETGFSARASGAREQDGGFNFNGFDGYWWTSTAGQADSLACRIMVWWDDRIIREFVHPNYGYSVRCVKDE